jgi:RHS repeat-associated protein
MIRIASTAPTSIFTFTGLPSTRERPREFRAVSSGLGGPGRFPARGHPVWNLSCNLHRWYDPVLGRWLSQDPSGIAGGGQANLGEYCGNDPVNATDPTGLWKAVPPSGWWTTFESKIGGGHGGTIVVHDRGGMGPALVSAVRQAANDVDMAIDLLQNYSSQVGQYEAHSATDGKLLTSPAVRATLLNELKTIQGKLNGGTTTFYYDFWSTNIDTEAWEAFYTDYIRVGWGIHINPIFFTGSADQQARTILHELGRLYVGIGGEKPITAWDTMLAVLYNPFNYAFIKKMPKNPVPGVNTP